MDPLVILGTGLAGYTLAREFRKHDPDTPLLLVTADDGAFYSKPMLSNALAQGKTPEQLITASAERMAEQLGAEIRTFTRARLLEPASHRLETNQGDHRYRQLVLALGADPIRLPLEGNGVDAVLSINDRLDYARFREALGPGDRVIILGAGLIGCEFANDLAATGHAVEVVDLAPHPLASLAPAPVGSALAAALAGLGVGWHMERSAQRVDRQDGGFRVVLDDDSVLEGDLVLSAVGLRPRTGLARDAGLATGRGIRVDRLLRTTSPEIFALGDCAEVEGRVLPFVMPIMHAARALAATLSGAPTPVRYPAMPVVVKTPAWPLAVSPPPPESQGAWHIEQPEGGIEALYRDAGGHLLGFAVGGSAAGRRQALARELPPVLG